MTPFLHPDVRRLRAFIDGDTSGGGIADHLGACQTCRSDVQDMRAVLAVAREDFDPPAPAAVLDRVLARRAAGERRILPVADDAQPVQTGSRGRRIVVVVLLTTVAAVAAALPSSPLREWFRRLTAERPASVAVAPVRPDSHSAAPTVPETRAPIAGVAVPVAEEAWVTVDRADERLRIRLRVSDGNQLEVRGVGPAAAAVFRPRAGGVGVSEATAGELQIDVPRSAAHFVLRVNGTTHVVKTGDQLRILSARADTIGAELLLSPRTSKEKPKL